MKILALQPFHSGSHRQFLQQWQAHSRHRFESMTLPGRHFKYRMRQAAITFARQVHERVEAGVRWDVVWATDMLNLAEFIGLCPGLATVPRVAYFHENQLTYPQSPGRSRDYQFAFTNFTTCLAADAVWFNSGYHRDVFTKALGAYLGRLPKPSLRGEVGGILARSQVHSPGIESSGAVGRRPCGPLHVVWPHRWEHDKGPERFFAALERLQVQEVPFVVSVVGESFRQVPPVFAQARDRLGDRVAVWGYQASRQAYLDALARADVVVSTANHEFFGIAVLEAVASGCFPLVPQRLAYPETLGSCGPSVFFDGTPGDLATKLGALAQAKAGGQELWAQSACDAQAVVAPYRWPAVADGMDTSLEALVQAPSGGQPGATSRF